MVKNSQINDNTKGTVKFFSLPEEVLKLSYNQKVCLDLSNSSEGLEKTKGVFTLYHVHLGFLFAYVNFLQIRLKSLVLPV